jgi:sugar phosphate isomerase/epimerase
VTLALEPMHCGCAGEWTFLTSLEQASDLVGEIGSPALKLAVDTYHLCHEGTLNLMPGAADKIALVQLGDGHHPPDGEQNRCRLGEGRVPLKEIVAQLMLAGYRGFWEIELMGEDVETNDYCELLAQSKKIASQWFGAAARKIAS